MVCYQWGGAELASRKVGEERAPPWLPMDSVLGLNTPLRIDEFFFPKLFWFLSLHHQSPRTKPAPAPDYADRESDGMSQAIAAPHMTFPRLNCREFLR